MEILIFYIWVCNKKDIVFSVRIFFRICNIEIAHYTKKKDTKGKTKSMVFRKNNMHQCKTGHISRNK